MSLRQAFFLPAGQGQRFCIHSPAATATPKGAVLYLHPFAEELNKTRRMAALQVRALAERGFSVLQIDLFGCGDSSGDFGEATWEAWLDDAELGMRWLRQQTDAPLWLWGLRAGTLLAADAGRQLGRECNYLFWQPLASGSIVLQQMLRLGAAADLLADGGKGRLAKLRAQLAAGESVEIAGYRLLSALAAALEKCELAPGSGHGTLHWLDVSAREEAGMSPVAANCLAQWRASGYAASHRTVVGPAFWQTAEIEIVPALIDATLACMEDSA